MLIDRIGAYEDQKPVVVIERHSKTAIENALHCWFALPLLGISRFNNHPKQLAGNCDCYLPSPHTGAFFMRCVAIRHDASTYMYWRIVTDRNATHGKRIRVGRALI